MNTTSNHQFGRIRKLKKCGACTKGEHQNCVSIYCGCGVCPGLLQAKIDRGE